MSDGAPVWIPKGDDELRVAIEQGILDEGDHADFKRELAPGPKANAALAQDLAAMAVNGGLVIVEYVGNWLGCLRLAPITGYQGYLSHWQRDPLLRFRYPEPEYQA